MNDIIFKKCLTKLKKMYVVLAGVTNANTIDEEGNAKEKRD